MNKRVLWMIGFFVFIFIATFIFYGVKLYLIKWYSDHYEEPPVTISAEKATTQTWHPFLTSVGTLKASNGVDVSSEVSGQISSIHFESGEYVKQSDLLVQLNDAIDQQALQRDEAKLKLDDLNYHRNVSLIKQDVVSKSAVDAAKAEFLQAQAAVASDQVMIAKKQIRAPFSGKIGIRQVDVGQYVSPGQAMVTLQAMQPLYVDFSVPEQFLPALYKNQLVHIFVDAYPTQLFLGKISAINSKIDVNTRSIAARAILPNENEKLYPGLFAVVHVILPELQNVVTIPQTAVTYSLYGDSVYRIQHQGTDKKGKPIWIAVQKYIKAGSRRGSVVAITEGIKPGDLIVTSGQLKLHPHSRVLINNSVQLN